jgi:phage shock protein PspC (stress-responsive transcriptional regulator)
MDKEQRIANENLKEFIRYSSSPWRIVWTNFVAGIFRGLGTLLGASMVIALLIWLLTLVADMPLVGEYANNVKTTVSSYVRDTNYNDEFDRLGDLLERIEQDLKNANGKTH